MSHWQRLGTATGQTPSSESRTSWRRLSYVRVVSALIGAFAASGSAGAYAADTSTVTAGRVPADAEAFDRLFDRPEQPFVEPNALFIEGIEIIGNNKTLRSVIERRILVQPKDLLNEDRIEESRLRLLNTGFFKSVDVSLRRGSRPGQILLVIEVEERNTVLIDQIYMGFSSVSPVFGGIGIAETNFLGRGVTVGGSMVIGQDRRGAEARLFVPYLSDTALQLSASAIFVQGAEAIDDRNPMELQLFYDRWGGSLGLGVGVGPSQRVSLIYRLESVRASNLRALMPSVVRRAPSILTDESVLSTLALTYERDTRDDPFVPSQGTRLALAVEAGTTLLGSSYEFSKYTGEAQHALSIIDGHSVIIRGFGGLIQGETPFFNQFFISDFAYFAWNRDSLRRKGQINFSESNDYDDLIFHVGVDYNIRMFSGDDVLYRMFVYGGVDLTFTASLDEIQEDPSGRGTGNNAPVSFDIGLKFDTSIGNFAFSLAYVLDLVY